MHIWAFFNEGDSEFQYLFFLIEVATSREGRFRYTWKGEGFQHLFFLLEIVTRELHLQCYRKSHSFVSTPFLLNRSRYCIIKGKRPTFIGKFQRLFFLMEVATWKKIRGYGLKATFQHLFFLMEVATGTGLLR